MDKQPCKTSFLVSCILAGLILTGCSQERPNSIGQRCPEVQKGAEFLRARYNPTIGLLNESPEVAPHHFWLSNDNALAAFTFDQLGDVEMSATLAKSILRYGSRSNGLIEVLWGETVDFPPYVADVKNIAQLGDDVVLQEMHTSGTRFEDWREYADLCFWGALNNYRQGRWVEAREIYAACMRFYDGLGFRDKAFDGRYETYKLALALYVGNVIEVEMPEAGEIRTALVAMQSTEGGFYTHYWDIYRPDGDANTETTSLAVLALWQGCRSERK